MAPSPCGRGHHEKKMGIDWAHTPENRHKHHQTSALVEPAGKEKKKSTKKHNQTGQHLDPTCARCWTEDARQQLLAAYVPIGVGGLSLSRVDRHD